MKKITFIFFIFFLGIVTAIFGYGFLFNKTDTVANNNYTVKQNNVITKSKNNTTTTTDKNNNVSVSKILNTEEVAKHNTRGDCYLIVKGKVYDVSSYIGQHPGGVKKITSNCGKEVTGIFAAIHSNFAWDLLSKYSIGDLK